MSDPQSQRPAKKINLRPIAFPKLDETTDENPKESKVNQLQQLSNQITEAKHQLQQTEDEIKAKQHESDLEIEKKRSDWQTEKVKLIEETRQVAYEAGYQDGKKQGYESVAEKIDLADQIVDSARSQQLKIIDQSESTVLELATKIASKIIADEIEKNEGFLKLVKQAIQEVHDQPSIKLYTSSDDFDLVSDEQDQLMTLLDPEIILSIHPLATLKQGDCIIKTPYSKLDVSVDQQLTKIKTRLFEVMEEIKREH